MEQGEEESNKASKAAKARAEDNQSLSGQWLRFPASLRFLPNCESEFMIGVIVQMRDPCILVGVHGPHTGGRMIPKQSSESSN